MVLRQQKKEDPYKSVRKKVPPPGYAIGNKKLEKKRIRRKEKDVIESGIEEYKKLREDGIIE